MDLNQLSSSFPENKIEWRIQQSGIKNDRIWCIIIPYIDSRAVQQRLDDVVGHGNWQTDYIFKDHGVLCKLSIFIDGMWVTKVDGSPETAVEGFKGGISKALVRAAVHWGIGRYLYDTPTTFGLIVDKNTEGAFKGQFKDKKTNKNHYFHFVPPATPKAKTKPKAPAKKEEIREPEPSAHEDLGNQPIKPKPPVKEQTPEPSAGNRFKIMQELKQAQKITKWPRESIINYSKERYKKKVEKLETHQLDELKDFIRDTAYNSFLDKRYGEVKS